MKRRALILVMALVLLVTMIPVPAFAASDFKTSDDGVDLIKYFEGFLKYPKWDYKQYTVGYGTRCPDDMLEEYSERGITEEEAEELLQKELESFENTLNKFIDKYDLKWDQAKFDAMVSFTYNVGGSWTTGASSQLFTQYVIAGKTGNDFLFAISLWSNAGGSMSTGLVKRRLIEANLYLNGVYSTKVPENYHYVQFDHTDSIYEGSARSIKLQGYDSTLTGDLHVRPEGKKDGYRFLGWYTAAEGGERIDTLTAQQAGKTLYAHWQKDGEDPSEGTEPSEPVTPPAEEKVIATGTVKLSDGTLNIRSGPGSSYSKVGSLNNGAKVEIYELTNGWGRISEGWISMDYVVLDEAEKEPEQPAPEAVIAKGLVSMSSGDLNIRKGAGTSYSKVGSVANGSKVELYEIVNVGDVKWGRIKEGWISLQYVKLAATGTVTRDTLNARKGAGTGYAVAGTYVKGDQVYVYETTAVGSATWGHTDKGWVNMEYVKLDKAETGVSGTITRDTLNIRKGAGTGYAVVGSYQKGDKVTIYETKEVGSATWGRTDKGWIHMDYVKLDGASGNDTTVKGKTGYVTRSTLNARKGAGSSYAVSAVYQKDDVITVYETTKVGSATWGRTGKGWVNMAYVQMDADTKPVTGTITRDTLNIRKGPGTGYDVAGSYKKGDKVSVYQTVTVGSTTWGRTTKGWISMAYVKTATSTNTGSTTVSRTGTVTATGTVNVRKGAGTGYDKVGTVKSGDKLTITRLKLVDGSAWGKISTGWVCLDFVKMNKPAAGAPALIMGSDLNIRKGAGTGYSVVGKYDKGTVVTILETKTVSGTTWGRTDKGWVSMDYVL